MVRIPLFRRQPKPDSSQAEGDGGKEAKARDASRAENEEQPAPEAPENQKPAAPQPVPENSSADPASTAGKNRRIPFRLKPREQPDAASTSAEAVDRQEEGTAPATAPNQAPSATPQSAGHPAADHAVSPVAEHAVSPAAEHAVSPAAEQVPAASPTPDVGLRPSQFVIGTDKRIPIPRRPPGYDARREKPDEAEGGKPWLPKLAMKPQPAEPESPAAGGTTDVAAVRAAAPVAVAERPTEDRKPEPSAQKMAAAEGSAEKVAAAEEPADEKKPEEEKEPEASVEKAPAVEEPLAAAPAAPATPVVAVSALVVPAPAAPVAAASLPAVAAAVIEQPPLVGQARASRADVQAILEAMPDPIFRIGPKGVEPVLGNGQVKPFGRAVMEELSRHHEHARKALETRQLQLLEFQVQVDDEARDVEARLVPLDQTDVLAQVRDVTDKVQSHNALIESRKELEGHLKDRNAELMRVNKMLKGEVELRSEQEEILKKNFRRLERLLEDTIGAITLIVEQRDPHVADHQRRVSQLAGAIGQELNLRNDQMRAVRMAAQLHDLGKIFIPAEILRKPGKLTPAEMSVVRTHPDTDYRILKRIDFPISIADVVRQHHERMDGSGYPQGLQGDAILMEARILAVADVVEGMVFERPYRVAPGLEAALKEIADKKGILYDTSVAEACLKLFAEGRFKLESVPAAENEAKAGLDCGGEDL